MFYTYRFLDHGIPWRVINQGQTDGLCFLSLVTIIAISPRAARKNLYGSRTGTVQSRSRSYSSSETHTIHYISQRSPRYVALACSIDRAFLFFSFSFLFFFFFSLRSLTILFPCRSCVRSTTRTTSCCGLGERKEERAIGSKEREVCGGWPGEREQRHCARVMKSSRRPCLAKVHYHQPHTLRRAPGFLLPGAYRVHEILHYVSPKVAVSLHRNRREGILFMTVAADEKEKKKRKTRKRNHR